MPGDKDRSFVVPKRLRDMAPTAYGDDGIIHIETVASAGSYVRGAPFYYSGNNIDVDYQKLLETYFHKTFQEYGSIDHLKLVNGMTVGQGTIVGSGGTLIYESAAEFLAHGLVPEGFQRGDDDQLRMKDYATVFIDRPTLVLKRPWYANYGHWLVDGASLCALSSKLSMPHRWQILIPKHSNEEMRQVVRSSIHAIAPGIDVVEHPDDEIWQIAELHYITPVHVPPLFKLPEGLSCLRSLLLRDNLDGPPSRDCIFIARPEQSSRRIVNQDEVIALCQSMGFVVVRPELMSILEQAQVFHRAKLIVGVKGAALTNALFCSVRTHLIVLSPADFPDPFFWDLVAQANVGYSEIFGALVETQKPQSHNSFKVDLMELKAVLEKCLSDLGDLIGRDEIVQLSGASTNAPIGD